MIGVGHQMQRRAFTEPCDRRPEQFEVGQSVIRPLNKEHRDRDPREMGCSLDGRLSGRVKGEGEKHQPSHSLEGRLRLGLGRHPPTERPPSGKKRKVRCSAQRFSGRGAHGSVSNRRLVHPIAALLHVRELKAQSGDAVSFQAIGDSRHRFVGHSRPSAMGENENRGAGFWRLPQTRNRSSSRDWDGDGFSWHAPTIDDPGR